MKDEEEMFWKEEDEEDRRLEAEAKGIDKEDLVVTYTMLRCQNCGILVPIGHGKVRPMPPGPGSDKSFVKIDCCENPNYKATGVVNSEDIDWVEEEDDS